MRVAIPAPLRSRRLLVWTGFLAAAAIGIAGGIILASAGDLPDTAPLRGEILGSSAPKLYDNAEPPELFAQIAVAQRTRVPLARMPRILLDATVAIEDDRFYSHWGIDVWGIMRAMAVNLIKGRIEQGGSTITQQLAKTLFLTPERTIRRKVQEALLAIQIERLYKKDEILEMYLNQIYFGHGAYGVEQAARGYFGKNVEDLTLAEAALLAGLPKAPSGSNPRNDLDKATARRNLVLTRMVKNGYIRREEAEAASTSPIHLRMIEMTNAPYFVAYLRKHLEDAYGTETLYRGGLSVYTTLNLRYQNIAQRTLEHGLTAAESLLAGARRGGTGLRLQGALVALDPRTGAILAMVGGRNFRENEFNRAVQARRQPGSSFKPFIYATALSNGFTLADVRDDRLCPGFPGIEGKVWRPKNFEGRNFGRTSLRRALYLSRNVVTTMILNQVGVRTVIGTARKFGYTNPFRDDLTMALGTSELSLLEHVSAFSVFANGGVRATPFAIRLVKNGQGAVLEQHRPELTQSISPQVSCLMASALRDVIDHGTAQVVRRLGFRRPAGGKTGSTNGFTDAWFVGFTPSLACGIWIGYDDRHELGKNGTGGLVAAPVWAAFMSEATEGLPVEDFPRPTGVVEAVIDPKSGKLATEACEKKITELFVEGTEPGQNCELESKGPDYNEEEMKMIEQMSGTVSGGAGAPERSADTPADDAATQDSGF